jgi:hypothetical protein
VHEKRITIGEGQPLRYRIYIKKRKTPESLAQGI